MLGSFWASKYFPGSQEVFKKLPGGGSGSRLTNYVIAPEATVGKYGKIAKLPRHTQIVYAFAYVFAMFAAPQHP